MLDFRRDPLDRPFNSVQEHDEHIISLWNSNVDPKDNVYILGDLSFLPKGELLGALYRMNGNKHLVLGNHDKRNLNNEVKKRFCWVKDYYELKYEGQHIVMSHYPMLVWNKHYRGSWMLHGHSHGHLKEDPLAKRMDVGLDAAKNLLPSKEMRPLSFEEVKKVMDNRGFKALDHHGAQ